MKLRISFILLSLPYCTRTQFFLAISLVVYVSHLLILAGDVEVNPGPGPRMRKTSPSPTGSNLAVNRAPSSLSSLPDQTSQADHSLSNQLTNSETLLELRNIHRSIATLDTKIDRVVETIDSRVTAVETRLTTVQSDLVALAERIRAVESKTFTLAGNSVSPAMATVPPTTVDVSQKPLSLSDVMAELHRRDTKKNNVIVSGLQSVSGANDLNLVSDLFSELGIHVVPTLVKRVGKSIRGQPPLLLVVLPNHDIRSEILHKAKELRHSINVSSRSVFINPDRTWLEREEFKHLRSQRQVSSHNLPPSVSADPCATTVKTIFDPNA